DSEFDNYVKYCTQRTADDGKGIMPIGSSTASITADNYDWTDGSKCAQSNPTMDSYATYYNWCYVQYATSKRVKSCTDKTPEANSAASSTAPTGNIAQEAAAMGGWGGQYQACYTDGGGHGDLADLQRRIAAHFAGPENGVDCSGFTRAVVYQATGTDTGSMSTQDMCADASGPKKFYEKIPQAQAQPGDMAIRCDAHVEVITGVNGGKFSTVGSHTTGCGPGFGPSPGNEQGNGSFVLRFKGGTVSV
ncbi:MAG: hypothetical protein JWO07_423, partial [Candidatus Saccharibacteria bacterium]|nr:hypothetical protein [Candidatus Saccharibacteria bacterium]